MEEGKDSGDQQEAHARHESQADRDQQMRRLDEQEIRERILGAFDRLIVLGYEVSLVGVAIRNQIMYRIELASDGSGDTPVTRLTDIAGEFRLDLIVDADMGLVFYPRL